MCYEEEYPYYEPTIADEIMMEYQQKMKEALLESIKYQIEHLITENTELKEENKRMQEKVRSIENRERSLEFKEKDIESRVNREFYNKKFSEILTPYEDQMILWIAENKSYLDKKCNLCDTKRQITYTAPDGSTIKKDCKCKKYYSQYNPTKINMVTINLYKSDSYDKKFIITPKYDSDNYDKNYSELKISYVFETFNPTEIKDIKLKYDCYIGFKSKEECQKYCNWLNENKNNNKDDIDDED